MQNINETDAVSMISMMVRHHKSEPMDVHCPLADDSPPGTLNFWSSSCKIRHKDPEQPMCFGGCKTHLAKPKQRRQESFNSARAHKLHLTEHELEALIEDIKSGQYTTRQLADKHNISKFTIRRRKQQIKHGTLKRSRVFSDETKAAILDMFRRGVRTAEIAECLKMSVNSIVSMRLKYAREYGEQFPVPARKDGKVLGGKKSMIGG